MDMDELMQVPEQPTIENYPTMQQATLAQK
jgi:hypothetical protein